MKKLTLEGLTKTIREADYLDDIDSYIADNMPNMLESVRLANSFDELKAMVTFDKELQELINACCFSRELKDLKMLVGPSAEMLAASNARIRRLDEIYILHENTPESEWPEETLGEFKDLRREQNYFEGEFC